jgi:uncharacterized protein (DUF433 family)
VKDQLTLVLDTLAPDKVILMIIQVMDQHIESTPEIAGGEPRIAGHRITVRNIAVWHERLGKSVDEICSEYDLTLADVYAALAYYFDHREAIDSVIEKRQAFVATLRKDKPSLLEMKLTDMQHG